MERSLARAQTPLAATVSCGWVGGVGVGGLGVGGLGVGGLAVTTTRVGLRVGEAASGADPPPSPSPAGPGTGAGKAASLGMPASRSHTGSMEGREVAAVAIPPVPDRNLDVPSVRPRPKARPTMTRTETAMADRRSLRSRTTATPPPASPSPAPSILWRCCCVTSEGSVTRLASTTMALGTLPSPPVPEVPTVRDDPGEGPWPPAAPAPPGRALATTAVPPARATAPGPTAAPAPAPPARRCFSCRLISSATSTLRVRREGCRWGWGGDWGSCGAGGRAGGRRGAEVISTTSASTTLPLRVAWEATSCASWIERALPARSLGPGPEAKLPSSCTMWAEGAADRRGLRYGGWVRWGAFGRSGGGGGPFPPLRRYVGQEFPAVVGIGCPWFADGILFLRRNMSCIVPKSAPSSVTYY